MANPNPKLRNDYRDYADNPKVRTRDILMWIYDKGGNITSRMVAEKFEFGVAEGAARLSGLKKWGCMKIVERGKGSQSFIWNITLWGEKMAKKWKEDKI